MRISHRGLYALKALLHLAEAHERGLVSSRRGREGGYRLRRSPSETLVGEVVRIMDGPLAPFGDAVELAHRVRTEPRHAGLFDLFLDVRNAAAAILDHTTLADVVAR